MTTPRASSRAALADSRGRLCVVTGPSGAGKGTVIRELLRRQSSLEAATSATTRPRRSGEVDGREYHFLDEADFDRRVAAGEFLEHVVYVSGQRYGTLRSEVERILGAGRSCVLELETQGARAVKQQMPDAVTVFISAPSFDELRRRLVERATESAGEIDERLALAARQMTEAADFDHVVVNDDVERAVAELEEIVAARSPAAGTLDDL
ncbi:MAG: guanylate kinase [Gaiellales bacterium]